MESKRLLQDRLDVQRAIVLGGEPLHAGTHVRHEPVGVDVAVGGGILGILQRRDQALREEARLPRQAEAGGCCFPNNFLLLDVQHQASARRDRLLRRCAEQRVGVPGRVDRRRKRNCIDEIDLPGGRTSHRQQEPRKVDGLCNRVARRSAKVLQQEQHPFATAKDTVPTKIEHGDVVGRTFNPIEPTVRCRSHKFDGRRLDRLGALCCWVGQWRVARDQQVDCSERRGRIVEFGAKPIGHAVCRRRRRVHALKVAFDAHLSTLAQMGVASDAHDKGVRLRSVMLGLEDHRHRANPRALPRISGFGGGCSNVDPITAHVPTDPSASRMSTGLKSNLSKGATGHRGRCPSESLSAGCDRSSTPVPAAPAKMPHCGPALPNRPMEGL